MWNECTVHTQRTINKYSNSCHAVDFFCFVPHSYFPHQQLYNISNKQLNMRDAMFFKYLYNRIKICLHTKKKMSVMVLVEKKIDCICFEHPIYLQFRWHNNQLINITLWWGDPNEFSVYICWSVKLTFLHLNASVTHSFWGWLLLCFWRKLCY